MFLEASLSSGEGLGVLGPAKKEPKLPPKVASNALYLNTMQLSIPKVAQLMFSETDRDEAETGGAVPSLDFRVFLSCYTPPAIPDTAIQSRQSSYSQNPTNVERRIPVEDVNRPLQLL